MEVKPGYRQTDAGVIPEDWDVQCLSSLVTKGPKNGYSGLSSKDARGTPTLSLGATTSGTLVLNDETVKHLEETIDGQSDLFLRSGDVLVQRSNTIDLVGTTAVFDGPSGVYVHPDLMMRMRFREEATAHWFWRYANSADGRRYFMSVAAGSSGSMPKLSGETMRRMQLPIPPLTERRVIAAALSDVDALLAGQDRLIAKKRDLKQAALQQLVRGKTRLPGFAGEWAPKQLGDIADIVNGGTPRTSVPAYWDGGVRWCTPTDITGTPGKYLHETERTISGAGLRSCSASLLPVGALLLCSRATIGEVRIAAREVCTNQGFKSLVVRSGTSNDFLYYLLLTMKPQMLERAIGSTFLEISKKDTASLDVWLPPLDEQRSIAAALSDMDAEIDVLVSRRDKIKVLKQGMVQELLTGRTRLL